MKPNINHKCPTCGLGSNIDKVCPQCRYIYNPYHYFSCPRCKRVSFISLVWNKEGEMLG